MGKSQARRIAQAARGRLECLGLSGADLFRLLAAAPRKAKAENIAGFAPSFTGTTFHSGSGNAGLYVVRYIDFFKKNVGYIPSVKYGDTP